jgi:competence protein ComEA
MLKKILAILVMLYASVAFAAVEVNRATAADLDAIKGIGPVMSKRILDERKKSGDFKSWEDFINRVTGVGEVNAAKYSAEGLTVGGAGFKKAAESKKDEKKAAKEAKKDAKATAKEEKKEAKAEKKEDKKEEKTAAAKPAASAAKPAASAAKPAASAKK